MKLLSLRRRPKTRREIAHILGIACTGHGASLAYVSAQGVIRSSVLERWAGSKHALMFTRAEVRAIRHPQNDVDRSIGNLLSLGFGRWPEICVFEQALLPWVSWLLDGLGIEPADIDLVVTSESHFATNCLRLGPKLGRWFPAARIEANIEHHEIHQCQAFWQSGFDEAAVLTLDTCGEDLPRLQGQRLAGTISVMNNRGERTCLHELLFPQSSAGLLYDTVNRHVGFRQGDEGKTMGLAPYGRPTLSEQFLPQLQLHERGDFTFLSPAAFQQTLDAYVPAREPDAQLLPQHEDVAYAGQSLLDSIVSNAFAAALRLTGCADLAYAGGVALNSVANDIAYRHARPRRLYIATNPGDPGHALGCALHGAYAIAGWHPTNQETPEYLGPPYSLPRIQQAMTGHAFPTAEPDQLAECVARCIANGYIVARFAGGAEFGPRALGNRSLLCDPRRPDMKDYLNAKVKHREGFRPFAPTVLLAHANQWFDLDDRSPYMLRVVSVHPDKRDMIPAIVHVDGTARVQTLTASENPGYWEIVSAFHQLTGVPLVLNTSFNLAGKPIVETPADALECFASTEIDLLLLGPYLLSKRPLETYLESSRDA